MIFAHFQTKRDITRGAKTLQWGANIGAGGGGFGPSSIYVKKGPVKRSDTLTRHKRTHTSHKAHECDVCNKRFTTSSNLITHQRTHTSDKPYEYDVCDERFNQSRNLIRHKKHTQVRSLMNVMSATKGLINPEI